MDLEKLRSQAIEALDRFGQSVAVMNVYYHHDEPINLANYGEMTAARLLNAYAYTVEHRKVLEGYGYGPMNLQKYLQDNRTDGKKDLIASDLLNLYSSKLNMGDLSALGQLLWQFVRKNGYNPLPSTTGKVGVPSRPYSEWYRLFCSDQQTRHMCESLVDLGLFSHEGGYTAGCKFYHLPTGLITGSRPAPIPDGVAKMESKWKEWLRKDSQPSQDQNLAKRVKMETPVGPNADSEVARFQGAFLSVLAQNTTNLVEKMDRILVQNKTIIDMLAKVQRPSPIVHLSEVMDLSDIKVMPLDPVNGVDIGVSERTVETDPFALTKEEGETEEIPCPPSSILDEGEENEEEPAAAKPKRKSRH